MHLPTPGHLMSSVVRLLTLSMLAWLYDPQPVLAAEQDDGYDELVALFHDWRSFEDPPLLEGAPNYTAEYFEQAQEEFESLRGRLNAIDRDGWPIDQKVDWHVVRAEMNGFDFNVRVLRPWARDPAFYQSIWTQRSDVPAHEGPTHHAVVELWTYEFPLTPSESARLTEELSVIAPLMQQARSNLTGNARDLWVAGIRNIQAQGANLAAIRDSVGDDADPELLDTIAEASAATDELVLWLEQQAPSRTGPSGVGREDYTWYQQNVHYVPLTWDQERFLLQRELDRAWSTLELEEHHNRDLPPLEAIDDEAAFERRADLGVQQMMSFLADEEIMPITDYMEPAFRAHKGSFAPASERNFFQIVTHHDPRPLLSHSYHWVELARMENEPHPSEIRRGPLLYNIFDSRNEGTATGVEELFMHAGLYDDTPRARELIYIMLAQRAARGLGSLYAQANEMTMAEAGTVHVAWTPRHWMGNEPELLAFEQHLYLRQPGYGTSYVTGKYLLERLLALRTKQMEDSEPPYTLSDFFAEFSAAGSVPTSLIQWQLTGDDTDLRKILGEAP